MTSTGFDVLSEVYSLLSRFSSEQLLRAAHRRNLSPHLKIALQALSREAGMGAEGAVDSRHIQNGTSEVRATSTTEQRERPKNTSLHKGDARSRERMLTKFLSDRERFPSSDSLVDFARRIGIKRELKTRYGRDRLVRQIVLGTKREPVVIDRVEEILRDAPNPQTAGWLDVILRS